MKKFICTRQDLINFAEEIVNTALITDQNYETELDIEGVDLIIDLKFNSKIKNFEEIL